MREGIYMVLIEAVVHESGVDTKIGTIFNHLCPSQLTKLKFSISWHVLGIVILAKFVEYGAKLCTDKFWIDF